MFREPERSAMLLVNRHWALSVPYQLDDGDFGVRIWKPVIDTTN